ncbi:hypothetical protein ABW19_dt0207795 [Dactylella cylindrospora]|nr:hypothetical protein ABW19_dt0207795 [Dactylella cylindrospora]
MAWKAALIFAALMASPSFALPQRHSNVSPAAPSETPAVGSLISKIQDPEVEVFDLGPITDAEIEELTKGITKRADNGTSSDSQGAFADIPQLFGDVEAEDGQEFIVDGPFSSIEAFVGDRALRGLILKDLDGNETIVGTVTNSKNAKRPGSFEFDDEEVVSDCTIEWKEHFWSGDKYVSGFHFGTNKGHKYNATSKSGGDEAVQREVGSGYPIRFHGILKKIDQESDSANAIVALGIEFLDDIRSIQMVSAEYTGFTDGVASIPDDGGKSVIAGTQILDNRNSSISQTFHLTNSKAISKQYMFTFSVSIMAGASVTLGGKLQIPFVTEGTASTTIQWALTVTATATLSHTETITTGGIFVLTCPAQKFCQGQSVFQTYELEVPFSGQFQATTRRGDKWGWNRKGIFKTSDVSNMKLQVNQYDNPPTKNVGF